MAALVARSIPLNDNPYSLTDLPNEVLRHIASHLDARSATKLARTSTHCHEPADANLWRVLTVTDRSPLPPASPLPIETSAAGTYGDQHVLVSTLKAGQQPAPTASYVVRKTLKKLERLPWRSGQVRVLDIDLIHNTPPELVDLIARVSGGLKELSLRTPVYFAAMSNGTFRSSYEIFDHLRTPLYALRHVTVDVNDHFSETLTRLLSLAPNIQHLHIHSYVRTPSTAPIAPIPVLNAVCLLPRLTELIVEDIHPSSVPAIQALVAQARRLRHVSLRDHAMRYRPLRRDPLLVALSRLDDLHTLEMSSACFDPICESGGFDRVEQLSITWDVTALESRGNDGLIIPPLPSLKTYNFDVSAYSTKWGTDFELFSHPHLAAMRILSATAFSQLPLAPSLAIIVCPTYPEYSRQQSSPFQADPRDHAFQGLVVYSWIRENRSGEETEEELLHCRSHVQTGEEGCFGEDCVMCSMGWEEMAWWRGREVPVGVLAAVYSAAGVSVTQQEPGRRKVLPKKGWEVLRCWEMME